MKNTRKPLGLAFSALLLVITAATLSSLIAPAQSRAIADQVAPTFTPTPIPIPNCVDSRLNCTFGDEYALIHNWTDAAGSAALKITCMDAAGKGTFAGSFNAADAAGFPAKPASNTLVKTITCGSVPVKFFILTTGQYQINIGPDRKGNTIAMVFTNFPPSPYVFHRLDADR